ncbi:uncharacterized protein CANTADRAFT_27462 [Suhomyces tanzawaensis NRRL Y-17324]|uniref:Uncharacterized protein n=1 Tax=Suhomyces tanzawaensis NRRL Y-17324 TaxID=984487 RepID=A0A1E4SCE1_9ASCO|nr:uncharacterized protein CANTADRAFT_27462 [Suhomyces tanzawaensis NRRL Y-17324]ODV77072.1 hypothetical protein CANTADRAFT_27462 [Suhomyces tanzawaensis NRRL Y-17324]
MYIEGATKHVNPVLFWVEKAERSELRYYREKSQIYMRQSDKGRYNSLNFRHVIRSPTSRSKS